MKKIIFLILMLAVVFTHSSCNSSKTPVCYNCGIKLNGSVNFCPECGIETDDTNDNFEISETIDYSDFGFLNNYNMHQWIEIRNYNFEDWENAYIETYYTPMVVIFENNYIYTRIPITSDETGLSYDGLISGKLYYGPEKYEVVSNNLIKNSSYGALEIIEVQIEKGIPIIHTDDSHFETVIPMDFIDFKRGVDVGNYTGFARYYIKPEYIK